MFDPSFALFVPGDRPDRFARALASGASGVILDLEDAVAPDRKAFARDAVARFVAEVLPDVSFAVRLNPANSPWFAGDLTMAERCGVRALMLPKVAGPESLDAVADLLGAVAITVLIESAAGVLNAAAIAAHPRTLALAFGPYDLAADLGSTDDWATMLPHRAHVLVAARAHGRMIVDGPSNIFHDLEPVARDASLAAALGYDGKLAIHPAQIATAIAAFRPSEGEITYATRIIAAAETAMPAVVDGAMIDAPMLASAHRILRRRH
jgi:citrate lyase subunit beta / citryl-CoA lyase